jgi:hypothetical protein
MKNTSHFKLIILAWLVDLIGLTAMHITKILKASNIIISLRITSILNKEMIIDLIQDNIKIVCSIKMISI